MKKIFLMTFVICFFISFFIGPVIDQASAAEKTSLNFVSYISKRNHAYKGWKPIFIDRLNKEGAGKIEIVVRGGPEVVGPFDLAEAVSRGTVDIAICPTAFYSSLVIGADSIRLSEKSVPELRQNGGYEALQEQFHAKGIHFLGWQQPLKETDRYMWVCSKDPIRSLADFKNKKMGGSPPVLGLFQSLGAIPVKASLREYYTALERGVIDGNWTTLSLYVGASFFSVAPYIIDHPFYQSMVTVIINLEKWNKLPSDMKQLLMKIQLDVEKAWPDIFHNSQKKSREKAIEKGAKFIKFSPEDAQKWKKTALEAGWQFDKKRFGNEMVQKLQKYLK